MKKLIKDTVSGQFRLDLEMYGMYTHPNAAVIKLKNRRIIVSENKSVPGAFIIELVKRDDDCGPCVQNTTKKGKVQYNGISVTRDGLVSIIACGLEMLRIIDEKGNFKNTGG